MTNSAATETPLVLYDLAQPLFVGMPCSPNQPGFRMALTRRHGDHVRADATSASSEIIVMGGHVGTHMDALSHASHNGRLYGGIDAYEAQRGGRFNDHGIEQVPPLIGKGVLLDIATWKGCDVLPGGYEIRAADLIGTARELNLDVDAADFVLIRSGWTTKFDDPQAYLGFDSGVPGPGTEAAEWLAGRNIRATGSDTIAYERIPPTTGHRSMPVHRILLVEHGIHIIEVMDLEPLFRAGVYEFNLLLAPLKVVGGTGAPIRPIAWAN